MAKNQKLKTHKGMQKRVKKTKTWKFMFDKSCNNHLLTKKGKNNKKFPSGKVIAKSNLRQVKALLPYS